MEHDILTPGEVAQMLRVDPKSVARWAQQGLIPYFRTPGGHRRFRRADIEALIKPGGDEFRLIPGPWTPDQVQALPDLPPDAG